MRRSTRFPYTTLFRSHQGCERSALAVARRDHVGDRGHAVLVPDAHELAQHDPPSDEHQRGPQVDGGELEPAARQDRKSTRLNSSHPVTSYAAFCLKKK